MWRPRVMRPVRRCLVLLALALAGANGAAAIEFQVVDSNKTDESQPAQLPSGCVVNGINKFTNHFTSTSAVLETISQGVVTGTDCDSSTQLTAGQDITLNVLGAPGATGEVCFVVRSAGTTVIQGADAAAQVTLAGIPIATPGGVFLNGNPVSTVNQQLNGNDADGGSDRGLITVTVGDQIRLAAGTQVNVGLVGAGTASGDALVGAAIYVGACPLERAPAASPFGLAGLAVVLAALGTLGLRWRTRGAR